MRKLILSIFLFIFFSACSITGKEISGPTEFTPQAHTPNATASTIPSPTPTVIVIPGLVAVDPEETVGWVQAGVEPDMAGERFSEKWQPPSLAQSSLVDEKTITNPDLISLSNGMLQEALAYGLPFATARVREFGEGDKYRAAVEARASNGNILWAIQRSEDGTFGLTEQPVVMEFRDGAYHLVDMDYLEIPNSNKAVILGGQGSDGTLWTAFREPVTLADGRQIYALYYDLQVLREENGKLVPGDWKFNLAVGVAKFGVIEGQAKIINDKFNVEALGFEADKVVQAGDSLAFIYKGIPVAIVDNEGNMAKPEQAFAKNGENWVGVVGEKLMSWDGQSLGEIELPEGWGTDQLRLVNDRILLTGYMDLPELIWNGKEWVKFQPNYGAWCHDASDGVVIEFECDDNQGAWKELVTNQKLVNLVYTDGTNVKPGVIGRLGFDAGSGNSYLVAGYLVGVENFKNQGQIGQKWGLAVPLPSGDVQFVEAYSMHYAGNTVLMSVMGPDNLDRQFLKDSLDGKSKWSDLWQIAPPDFPFWKKLMESFRSPTSLGQMVVMALNDNYELPFYCGSKVPSLANAVGVTNMSCSPYPQGMILPATMLPEE